MIHDKVTTVTGPASGIAHDSAAAYITADNALYGYIAGRLLDAGD
jgi:hypothetical protein